MRNHEVQRSQPHSQVADNVELVEMRPTHIDERLIPNRFATHGLRLGGGATALIAASGIISEVIGEIPQALATAGTPGNILEFAAKAITLGFVALGGLYMQDFGNMRIRREKYIRQVNSRSQTVFDGTQH